MGTKAILTKNKTDTGKYTGVISWYSLSYKGGEGCGRIITEVKDDENPHMIIMRTLDVRESDVSSAYERYGGRLILRTNDIVEFEVESRGVMGLFAVNVRAVGVKNSSRVDWDEASPMAHLMSRMRSERQQVVIYPPKRQFKIVRRPEGDEVESNE